MRLRAPRRNSLASAAQSLVSPWRAPAYARAVRILVCQSRIVPPVSKVSALMSSRPMPAPSPRRLVQTIIRGQRRVPPRRVRALGPDKVAPELHDLAAVVVDPAQGLGLIVHRAQLDS